MGLSIAELKSFLGHGLRHPESLCGTDGQRLPASAQYKYSRRTAGDGVFLQWSQEVAVCGSSGLSSLEATTYTLFTDIAQSFDKTGYSMILIFNDKFLKMIG